MTNHRTIGCSGRGTQRRAAERGALDSFLFGKMNRPVEKATLAKLKKLAAISAGLQNGEDYPIMRLTTLKSLCADQKVAAKFALHIAKLAGAGAAKHAPPQHLRM